MQHEWTQDEMIERFWSAVDKGLDGGEVKDHSIDPKLLAIRLPSVHAVSEQLGVNLPPVYLLRKAVRRCPRFLRIRYVRGPRGTKPVSCWIFRK